MYALLPKTSFRWSIIATLCFAICIHQTCAELSKASTGIAEIAELGTSTTPLHSLAETDLIKKKILQDSRNTDDLSKSFLEHILSSPNFGELAFVENVEAVVTLDQLDDLKKVESMIVKRMELLEKPVPKNAVTLQLWGRYLKTKSENLGKQDLDALINDIIQKIESHTQRAQKMAQQYAGAIEAKNFGVIMDNEADDLICLTMCFEQKIFPKFILVYGGFSELRYHSVLAFIDSASELYRLPENSRPKVYRGFPHPYEEDEERHSYDFEEGTNYIDDKERVKYMEISLQLEKELKDADGKWKPDAWKHRTFEPGLDAMRKMIDNAQYSAIAVLTCPAALTYLIREDTRRAEKIGVTMASPYSFELDKSGAVYKAAYNGGRQISLMNELLESKVAFIGVGGGTAKTKGLRTIHDYNHGTESAKHYSDKGLLHLEDVISPDHPTKMWQIIFHAGHNVSTGKWRDWDKMFAEFWIYLKIKPFPRDGPGPSRKRSQVVLDFIKQAAEEPGNAGITKSKKKKEEKPSAAKWGFDMVMTILRVWYLLGDKVRWQGPSADLHAIITNPQYTKGILGAVGYALEAWPAKYDENNKLIEENILEKFVINDESNHFSVSDMDYQRIIDTLQEILHKYFNLKQSSPSHPPSAE
ncbi:hypothetical protein CROQUDRAFT_129421 [Cronartium quercuum f. sp. fusiforme G11]|uniref:Uncharacterized protein n=1 Tax=Cronartium quercuum f. sp. fusiforme G11 TaxID=708437 RepID=A0A9P6TH39_9BASI|nr:hypothetical protein CROQUDRAFT_129421 [Cronartium quercuum f. sp. fusiforme G11]